MTVVPSLPVRGRDDQLAVLDQALSDAVSGRGSVTVIEGGPGMGKTRLLQAAWVRAAARGFRMGRGMADPTQRVVELAPLFEALFEHDAPLLDRSSLRQVYAAPEQRFWLLQEIQTLLEEVATSAPVLIVLDDLQWADSGTAAALRVLSARLAGTPIAWVLTLRPGQESASLQSTIVALVDAGATTLHLGPLDYDAIASIAADLLDATPDDALLKLLRSVNGNPFLLVDVVRGLAAEGNLSTAEGQVTLLEDRLPSRVSDGMRLRLARMSEVSERIATCAAALGRRFTVADIAAMTGMSVPDLVTPIRVLMEADILAESDDRLSFVHDLVRDAVRASVPTAVRRALDREGADVLLRRGALPVEVAAQVAESASFGDSVAIGVLADAAEALGITDPAMSAELAERALLLMPERHELRGPLVGRRAVSLFAAGIRDEAKRYVDTVLRQTFPPAQQAQMRLRIASMFGLAPDIRVENARHGLALPDLPSDLRAELMAAEVHNLVVGGRVAEAVGKLSAAEAAARECGSQEAEFAMDLASAGLDYQQLEFSRGLARLDAAIARGTSEDVRARLAAYFRGWLLAAMDRFDEAIAVAEEGARAARRDRQHWALSTFETLTGIVKLQSGRLPDAVAALEGHVSLVDGAVVGGVIDAANLSSLAFLRVHTADEWGSRETVRMCEAMINSTSPAIRAHAAWGLAAHANAHGQIGQAHKWLRLVWDAEAPYSRRLYPHDIASDAEVVRVGLAVGDHELVSETLAGAIERLRLNPDVSSIAACVHHLQGLITHSSAELAKAVPLMRSAGRPLAVASLLEDYACSLLAEGSTADGIEMLDEALDLAVGIGATRLAGRVRGRLREHGVRRRVLLSTGVHSGWDALTPTESQVAQLVVDGCTNREIAEQLFVSLHTVNTHVRHIFEKVQVRSRFELARLANRHDNGT
ncbi:helix-turn-helix transcriptional regulator [Kribbella jiaozuonensis]|uniref:helix-turn-helix transcriptional regulator n=1 Tax=Kribbella jiaozuonensis TaxID=2575441 RepID=UPI0014850F40|nr:AAA family ATPase [Kribbella jiaozuonensis]